MNEPALQYLADERGDITAVVVPIATWREITSELETQHLLRSPAMRERLLTALGRDGGYTLRDVLDQLGISEHL
jgi:PHD/YefM family antitoxin component YafN of YafNO toxin-antitoxin module